VRFIADSMLGALARWLRLLGHDVAYAPDIDDDALIDQAISESRVLLTRDTHLLQRHRRPQTVFIRNDDLASQLRQVHAEQSLPVREADFLTRCAECNGVLAEADKESVRGSVPPHVFAAHERFLRCPGCHRVYWAGSHLPSLRDRLRKLLGEERLSGPNRER
jgi:uncharacterized protein with PIN domain